MKPSAFTYHDPRTVDDAVALLNQHDNARPLAGGQSLMAMINMRFVQPDHLIDLNRIDALAGIAIADDTLQVGAMTRQRALEFSADVAERLPLMREALLHVGHRQTRNRGTLGGSLCHLDPAAEMVAVANACDAVVTVAGPDGERELSFSDFPLGFMTPALAPGELLVGIRYPLWPAGHGACFTEYARRHGDFAIASAAALVLLDAQGRIARAALTLGGVSSVPLRMTAVERMLVGNEPTEALLREASELCRQVDALEDALVTAAYRRSLAVVMCRRALSTAIVRAGGPAVAALAAHAS